jgi:hypothetical protein
MPTSLERTAKDRHPRADRCCTFFIDRYERSTGASWTRFIRAVTEGTPPCQVSMDDGRRALAIAAVAGVRSDAIRRGPVVTLHPVDQAEAKARQIDPASFPQEVSR